MLSGAKSSLSPPGAAYGTSDQINPPNPYIVATANEIQSFPLFLVHSLSEMVFSPCCLMESFREVIPVTAVTSFPRRLVVPSGSVGAASEAECPQK